MCFDVNVKMSFELFCKKQAVVTILFATFLSVFIFCFFSCDQFKHQDIDTVILKQSTIASVTVSDLKYVRHCNCDFKVMRKRVL